MRLDLPVCPSYLPPFSMETQREVVCYHVQQFTRARLNPQALARGRTESNGRKMAIGTARDIPKG